MGVSLDRFAYGKPDSAEAGPVIIGACPSCGEKIYDGFERVEWEDEVFCDLRCFAKHVGAKEVY